MAMTGRTRRSGKFGQQRIDRIEIVRVQNYPPPTPEEIARRIEMYSRRAEDMRPMFVE